jgi:excisionase family DNA binding protein
MTARPYPFTAPRGLSRANAAAYVGVSTSKFDDLVSAGIMPKPIRIGRRLLFDRQELDECFDLLHEGAEDEPNDWD